MKSLMDTVQFHFNGGGTKVIMEKTFPRTIE